MNLILSVDPVRFPLTGIGRYTYELARALETADGVDTLRYFSGARFVPSLPSASDTSDGGYGLRRAVQKSALAIEMYRILMPLFRTHALRGCSDSLYHGTNFFIPPFSGKSVATFHDLSPFIWAHCHPAQRIRYLQKELGKTLKRADALITDSEYTRQELAAYFSWPIERIHTVPLASSDEFRVRGADELRDALTRHGLVYGGYSLFVGTLEPRKNIETLLDAYSRLPVSLKKRWPLVLTGYQGWRNDAIRERLDRAVDEGWARYLGFVPGEDLPLLFAGARLFTFPSLYEGFGMPVLEAMSSGVPVVCSNSSSLPEVAGNVALMCDPMDIDTLTDLLAQGLEDESWRDRAITDGLDHAASFSWQRCAMQTMAVYGRVLSTG